MGYDRGDSFPFEFEPNGTPFGSKSKGKLSPRSYRIQFERKLKHSFLSVQRTIVPTDLVSRGMNAASQELLSHCPLLEMLQKTRG